MRSPAFLCQQMGMAVGTLRLNNLVLFRNALEEALLDETDIIADRYAFSGVAYSTAALGFDTEWAKAGDEGLIAPDLVFFLDHSNSADFVGQRSQLTGEKMHAS